MKMTIRMALIFLTGPVAASAAVPASVTAQAVTGEEARDILVAVLEHHVDARETRSFDDAVLAGASVEPGITLEAPPDFDLLQAVARETGMTVDTMPQERWCDTSGRRPVWRVNDPTLRVEVSLRRLMPDSASVSRIARVGTSRGGSNVDMIGLRRGVEGGWALAGVEARIHGRSMACRPAPPAEVNDDDLIELVRTAVLATTDASPLCIVDILDGWLRDLVEARGSAAFGEQVVASCRSARDAEPGTYLTPDGTRVPSVALSHTVFRDSGTVRFHLMPPVPPPGVECPETAERCFLECTFDRPDDSWEMGACRPVRLTLRYPGGEAEPVRE